MSKNTYTTFEQIETDLEILKIEKEINYQKVFLEFQRTKEHFTPSGLTKNIFSTVKNIYSGLSNKNSTFLSLFIPFAINWLVNKKRSR